LREETGMTLLLTTHLMDEAERCDRLAILDRGRLVALDSPAALRQVVGGMVLTLTLAADASPEDARQLAEQLARRCPEAATPPSAQGRVVRLEDPHAAPLAHEIARELGDRLQSLTIGQPTLDDVFVHLTGRHLQRDA
jgi:ABC-2 type transport system ATP-binding protein